MEIGYIGGIVQRGSLDRRTWTDRPSWHWAGEETESFLHAGGAGCTLYSFNDLAVLVRGVVRDSWARRPGDGRELAEKIARIYRDNGTLIIDGLEGSFTLALIDGPKGTLLLHRNLVGDSHTYYHRTRGGLMFSSNLADLLTLNDETLRPNRDELPTYFLNRNVPGRNTLFSGYHRVLPGEQLDRKHDRVRTWQRRTIGDLRESRPIDRDAAERLEETIGQVLADYRSEDPNTANLLSGGVDSSFLQVHWNRVREATGRPRSYCVAVNHPRTRGDREYAESAAAMLGTDHCVVPADGPYLDYLMDTMTATAEMPSHVQLAYYLSLGRTMAEQGHRSALLGEGADSLFGLGTATTLQNAALLRRLFPTTFLRRCGGMLARTLGRERVRGYFHLAEHLYDYERLDHPINRVAVYADWPAVEACFGKDAVIESAASRRALLDQHHVAGSPLERVHYAGVLGSSINISALVTTLFARCGVRTFSPFYDSRMLRLAVNLSPRRRFRFRNPKALLKDSLARHGYAELAHRSKKSFGQPVFEWLSPGGQLAPLVDRIDDHPFLEGDALTAAKAEPTWFLYSLLCYDLWHKTFITGAPLAAF